MHASVFPKGVRAIAILALLWSAGLAPAQETYRINLTPAAHPGQKFKYSAVAKHRSQSWSDGSAKLPADSFTEFYFDAVATVDSCDAKSRASAVTFSEPSLSNDHWPLLNTDREITARCAQIQNDPPVYQDVFNFKDEPVNPLQAAALRQVVTIGNEKELTEQEAFGTDKPLGVSDSWNLDGDRGARLLEKMQFKVDPAHVKGAAQLLSKFVRGGKDCLEIHMLATCDQWKPPVEVGQTVVNGSVIGNMTVYVEIATGQIVESTYKVESSVVINSQTKHGFSRFQTTTETSKTLRLEPVERKPDLGR